MAYRVEVTNNSNSKLLRLRKVKSLKVDRIKEDLTRVGIPGQQAAQAQIVDLTFGYEDVIVDFILQGGDDVSGSALADIPAIIAYIYDEFYTTQAFGVNYTLRLVRAPSTIVRTWTGSIEAINIVWDSQAELANGTLRLLVGQVI